MAKININTATVDELRSLPGIGPGLAKRIREYIRTNGAFTKVNDIASVNGISEDLLKDISEHISLFSQEQGEKAYTADEKSSSKDKLKPILGRNRAKLRFASHSSDPVTIEFANTKLLGKKGEPLSSLKLQRLPNIRTEDKNFVDFRIPLSRFTPPGSHTLEVLLDGSSHLVELEVEEKVQVSFSPLSFFIKAAIGTTVDKDLFVKNMGNFPIVFDDPGPVILETDFVECRTIRHVVRKMDKEKASLDQVLCLAVEKLEEIYDEGSTMRIKVNGGPKTIAPGESQKIRLNISIPKTLKRPNRYTGVFPFYNTAISFVVNPI